MPSALIQGLALLILICLGGSTTGQGLRIAHASAIPHNLGGIQAAGSAQFHILDRRETRIKEVLAQQTDTCQGEFIPVSKPLTELGNSEYIRLNTGPTGFTGGLYPDGSNTPPAVHLAFGLEMAAQVVPRDPQGRPDPNGKIVLISIGMSNTAGEFGQFAVSARGDGSINPHLVIINGAQGGKVATYWLDPQGEAWQFVDNLLAFKKVTPQQVQVAWVKLTNFDLNDFPQDIQTLQSHLEIVARNLKSRFPNLKIAYYSSRTRAYAYFEGANPEPGAFETGFSVKWMIEKQIDGNPSLNFRPESGPVLAPYLAWGPYLWIDGLNPRSDGRIWEPIDLKRDCVHPSDISGKPKVVEQLMQFFKTDPTARTWFLADPPEDEPTFLPTIFGNEETRSPRIRHWRTHAR